MNNLLKIKLFWQLIFLGTRLVWQRTASLLSFLVDLEPTLNINGSCIKFKASGDLIIGAGRHLILDYDKSFSKCDPSFIASLLEAEASGFESLQEFLDKESEVASLQRPDLISKGRENVE